MQPLFTRQTWVFLAFIVFLSFLTYFWRYWEPAAVFWDENYHIASAQKYLNGVYFMEQHPPLGKELIALGEFLLHPNTRTDQFIGTDYATDFQPGFSFAGYRFFSALLGWFAAPVLFLVFLLIARNPLFAALLSFLYVFDNALVVHIRGAMLEGPLMCFSVLTILAFLALLEWGDRRKFFLWGSVLFGVAFGLTFMTKLFGLALILFLPAYLVTLLPNWKKMVESTGLFIGGFLLIFCSVWYVHFALGKTIVSTLPDNGYYQASPEYRQLLGEGKTASLLAFPIMVRDSLAYVPFYNRGAPRIDLCKADENGSPFYLWPLGARAINYRWETPDGTSYRYLYLQSNPVVWLLSSFGVLVGFCLLLASYLFDPAPQIRQRYLLAVFVGLYAAYMIAISMIDRVLYLYHYFSPLLLSMIVLGIVLLEIQRVWRWRITEPIRTVALLVLAALIFVSYEYYRPLSYYEPITDAQFNRRNLLPIWELTNVHTPRVNSLAVPCR
jgi:dolichyl-phosphate-mannose--protein O-mannosyl transferase